jgi:hypothetical protein
MREHVFVADLLPECCGPSHRCYPLRLEGAPSQATAAW